MMTILAILCVNAAAWPFVRRLARWSVQRERRAEFRRQLDAWGVDDDPRR